jgi:hypothetical protein
MMDSVKSQFQMAKTEPTDGLQVVLVDQRADSDEDGKVCDMVVNGTMRFSSEHQRWSAEYVWDQMTWVPSETD